MSDSGCPVCGAKKIAGFKLPDDEGEWECARERYTGESGGTWGCPNAERLLAEARETIARMTPVVDSAVRRAGALNACMDVPMPDGAWHAYSEACDAEKEAVDAYRGTR